MRVLILYSHQRACTVSDCTGCTDVHFEFSSQSLPPIHPSPLRTIPACGGRIVNRRVHRRRRVLDFSCCLSRGEESTPTLSFTLRVHQHQTYKAHPLTSSVISSATAPSEEGRRNKKNHHYNNNVCFL